jgi:glutamine amidotransferase
MSEPNIAIVDYQAGNVSSVQKAIAASGGNAEISSEPDDISNADALVFPGQGACDSSMRELNQRSLVEPIKDFIKSGKPFLGICLGLQLLLDGSDEGSEPGLGILRGHVRRLPNDLKVPHMGWNRVQFHRTHPLFDGIPNGSYFYFVHSYYADLNDKEFVIGTTDYGVEFCSAAGKNNVLAVQFHPEKSGSLGLRIYGQFVQLVRKAKL